MEPSRRAFLGTVLSLPVAGCPALDTRQSNDEEVIEVFVGNQMRENKTVTVIAKNESGTTLFEHTYRLQAQHGNEAQSVPAVPDTVEVTAGDGRQETFDFSIPLECEHPQINIWVRDEEIHVNNGCPT